MGDTWSVPCDDDPTKTVTVDPVSITTPGTVVVRLLNPNQCGTCQHWSWEHAGPQHPCGKCDCGRLTSPDPDRTDANIAEPE